MWCTVSSVSLSFITDSCAHDLSQSYQQHFKKTRPRRCRKERAFIRFTVPGAFSKQRVLVRVSLQDSEKLLVAVNMILCVASTYDIITPNFYQGASCTVGLAANRIKHQKHATSRLTELQSLPECFIRPCDMYLVHNTTDSARSD